MHPYCSTRDHCDCVDRATLHFGTVVGQWTSRDEINFVRALIHRGAYRSILQFMQNFSSYPTIHHYTNVLIALDLAKHFNQKCIVDNHTTTTTRTSFYDSGTNQQICLALFQEMDQKSIQPSPYTFSAVFRAYHCTNVDDVVFLYQFLKQRYPYVKWTTVVWEAAILACIPHYDATALCNEDSIWRTAYGFYQDMISHQYNNTNAIDVEDDDDDDDDKAGCKPSSLERVYMALFRVCAVTRNVTAASTLLNSIGDKDISTQMWGGVLKICAKTGDAQAAHSILIRMTTIPTASINTRHCVYYLQALVEAGEVQVAVNFLNCMNCSSKTTEIQTNATNFSWKDGLHTTSFAGTFSALINLVAIKTVLEGCATNGNYTLARNLLARVKHGDFGEDMQDQLDEKCYNFVIAACDSPIMVKEIIREMRLTRRNRYRVVPPSPITYTKAISVCRKTGDMESALFFLNSANTDGIEPDMYMYTAAIWTAAQACQADVAIELLGKMKEKKCIPSIVTYNGVIAALASCSRADEAVFMFREVAQTNRTNLVPNFTTFYHLDQAIRSVSYSEEKLALLWRIFHKMKAEQRQASVGGRILESLILAYGTLGLYEEAKSVFDSINGPPGLGCIRAILFACSQANPPEWYTALSLVGARNMINSGDYPAFIEPVSLCNVMLACSKADRWDMSLQLLRLYGRKSANIVAVNSLIASCGRGGRADLSVEILNDMEDVGLVPDAHSYRSAIIACNQAEHENQRTHHQEQRFKELEGGSFEWWECAVSLLHRMKENGLKPDKQTLSSAISACESAGEWQLALELLQRAMNENDDMNVFCFNAALSACEKGNAWVEALEIYERMAAEGGKLLRPNIVTLSSLILALDKAGQKELAVCKYDEGIRRKYIESPWRLTKDSSVPDNTIWAIDLHSYSAAMAKAAIRSHLNILLSGRFEASVNSSDWTIIVGKGLRSETEPVLKSAVQSLLKIEYGIMTFADEENYGRLIISNESLRECAMKRIW